MNNTPLRYPGGKSIMTPFIDRLISVSKLCKPLVYSEPYAGGAGTAINLLLSNKVEKYELMTQLLEYIHFGILWFMKANDF